MSVKTNYLIRESIPYTTNPESQNNQAFWDAMEVFTTDGAEHLIMIVPRLVMCLTGMFFVYIFNYYIFQLVTVLKMVAAIGMALAVLYYAFLRRVELPMAALGVWIFGNGWYILADIAMNQYYAKVQANSLSTQLAGVLLGAQGVGCGRFVWGRNHRDSGQLVGWNTILERGFNIHAPHARGKSISARAIRITGRWW